MPITPTQPSLGYGTRGSADINAVNQWMRSQPWYADLLVSMKQDPNNVHLNDAQKQQVIQAAQAHGVVVDEGHNGQEVDDSGNFQAKSHTLRNVMIVAGIAAAALATAGAAGAFGGAAGLGAGAGEAGAAGVLPATATVAGSAALPAGLESSLLAAGGAEAAGAGAGGLTAAELAAMGGELPADAAGAAVGGVLPSTATVAGSAELPAGVASGTDAAAAGNTGLLDQIGSTVEGGGLPDATNPMGAGVKGSTLNKLGSLAGEVGKGIGAVGTANGQNRLDQEHLGLTANQQNISGQSAFEQELMARAKEDAAQRTQALKDSYRNSYAQNPRVSPFDPAGAPKLSAGYTGSLAALADQASKKLATVSPYDTNGMPTLKPYTPINPADVQGATNTAPSTLSQVGQFVGPALTVAQRIAQLSGWGQ